MMKQLNFILFMIAIMAISATISSCGNKSHSHTESTEASAEMGGKEYSSAYVCPMHCDGSGSAEMGQCPVCGMDYVLNEEHKKDGHSHDDHEGHNH